MMQLLFFVGFLMNSVKGFFLNRYGVFLTYTALVIIYNLIFSSVYLGDTETLISMAAQNEINNWQMLGGYFLGKFSLLFSNPRNGLLVINLLFWILSLFLFHNLLMEKIKSICFVYLLCLLSPIFIFSNIIYKESFPIFFFLLVFTKIGWLSPLVNSILRVNLFIESILVYFSLHYRDKKWIIFFMTFGSLVIFSYQISLYNNEKQNIINTLMDSYIIGTKIQSGELNFNVDLIMDYSECREFEQLYTKKIISIPKVEDTEYLKSKLINLLKTDAYSVAMHMSKKLECVFINHNRYFLLPSATYRIGSEFRDYVMAVFTQLNPFFRPIVGLFLLLISGTLPLITRIFLICGLLSTALMHINPEARYFFPFILAGMLNSAEHMEKLGINIIKKINIRIHKKSDDYRR
jgi:hypothetical protein